MKQGPSVEHAEIQDTQEECVPENQRCGYWGLEMPCCNLGHCIMDHCVLNEYGITFENN